MNSLLSRLVALLVGHDRRAKNTPGHNIYCICGAFKRKVEGQESDPSLKTESRLQRV
jgi:hypothetical protein